MGRRIVEPAAEAEGGGERVLDFWEEAPSDRRPRGGRRRPRRRWNRLLRRLDEYHRPVWRRDVEGHPVRFATFKEAATTWDFNRIKIMSVFFFFKVALPFADVFSDIFTAYGFYLGGDMVWASVTLFVIFLPFLCWAISCIIAGPKLSVPPPLTIILLLQQLPVFQSFWFLYLFFQLATVNTNIATNEFFIHNMKGSGHFQTFNEAFMEAAPQLVLQLGIVLTRGFVGSAQLFSLITGLGSLSMAATMMYFISREEGHDDPDPSMVWAVPPVALLYVIIVVTNATTWAVVSVFLRWWAILAIVCFLSIGLFAASAYTRTSVEKRGEIYMQTYTNAQNVLVHPTMYLVTSWLAPCIVVIPKLQLLLINSIFSCGGCILILLSSVLAAHLSQFTLLEEYPSFLHCLPSLDPSEVGDVSVNASLLLWSPSTCLQNGSLVVQCGQAIFRICPPFKECLPTVRLCGNGEPPQHPLSLPVSAVCILVALQVMSVVVVFFLQWLSDYSNFCRITRGRYRHHSLDQHSTEEPILPGVEIEMLLQSTESNV